MNRVDKMRQKQAEKHGTPTKVSAASDFNNLFKEQEPKKEKPPAQQNRAMVEFQCGHQTPASAFKGTPCGECRARASREKKAARSHAGSLPGGRNPIEQEKRLPDRACFMVSYDALKKEWKGSLSVPDANGFKVFQGTAGGLEKLERDLARQCWEWMATANLQS